MNEDARMERTVSVAEVLDPLTQKIKEMEANFKANKTAVLTDMDQRRIEHARNQRANKIKELRAQWNAPVRHEANSANLDMEGEWGKKFKLLKAALGTGMFFALVGGRGPGKTQMAFELMKECTAQLKSAYFLTATEFFVEVKDTYHRDTTKTEKDVLARFKQYRLLVIDEVGKRGQSEWENNLLFEVINSRYNAMLDTVIMDNNEMEAFKKLIGPSLVSRLGETGSIIVCDWPSYRI